MVNERILSLPGSLFIMTLLLAAGASAQDKASQTTNAPPTQQAQQSATQPAQTSPAIGHEQAVYLVRSTLMMLNDANRSGNYTVLRDLASPDFQAKNSAADLAQIFSDLRRRNFDLFAAAMLAPQFTAGPSLDERGRLRLTGFFPTRPLRISFDLTFQSVGGQWRLFGVAVGTPQAPTTQSQLDRKPPRNSSGAFYGFRILSGTAGWRW